MVAAAHDFLSIFILLAFLLVKEGKVRLSIFLNIRNVSVIIGALLAGPIGMQANLYAVKYIGSSLASSVSAIYPAISVLLAFFFLKHKISKNTVFGIVLIIAGIIAQTYKVEQVNSFYIGILSALVCAIAWGSESVLSSFAMESELSEIESPLDSSSDFILILSCDCALLSSVICRSSQWAITRSHDYLCSL